MKREMSPSIVWSVILALVIVVGAVAYFVFREPPRPGPDDPVHPPAPPAAPGGSR